MPLTPVRILCIAAIFTLAIAVHGQNGYYVGADGRAAAAPAQSGAPARAGAGQGASGQISSMQWRDPAEGAFTVSLPRGWQISGGTVRTTQIEPHYVVHAQSPDGGVRMFMDDPNVLIGEVPNRGTQMIGVRPGQVVRSPWGGKMLIQQYTPAPNFAQQYARGSLCPSATQFQGGEITGQTQDLTREYQPIAQAEGKQVRVDVGEVAFKCGAQNGYVYAITILASQPGQPVQIWAVYRLAGYLATPQDGAMAGAAIHTMLGTFQYDQGWLQRFAQQSNDVAGNVIRESNAITQSTIERSKQEEAQEEANFASWKKNSDANFNAIEGTNRAINGSTPGGGSGNGHDYNAQLDQKTVCNDVGTCKTVDATVDNWWSDCSGNFYPGPTTGGPPPSSLSACWSKGH